MKSIMLLLYIISTCMSYKFKNNTRGKNLIHRNLRDWRKKKVIDCKLKIKRLLKKDVASKLNVEKDKAISNMW